METIARLKVCEHPHTDCKVTYSQQHPATNTLCVRLQPHVLVINRTDLPLLTRLDQDPTWIIEPQSVFHPAPVENRKFYLGLLEDGGTERWGSALELSDSDWTYLSIRPSIQGLLHLHGTVMYTIRNSQAASVFIKSTFSFRFC